MGDLGSPRGVARRGQWAGVPLGGDIEHAEYLFGLVLMGLGKEDFDRGGAKLVSEFVEWILHGRTL